MSRLDRTLAGVVLLALVLVALLATVDQDPGERPGMATRISYSRAPGGALALYESLQATGHAVARWRQPLNELPAKAAALVMLSPDGSPDWDAVKAWAGRGHLVVVAMDAPLERLAAGPATPVEVLPFGPGHGLQHVDAYGASRIDQPFDGMNPWTQADFDTDLLADAMPLAGDSQGTCIDWVPVGDGGALLLMQSAWTLSNHGLKENPDGVLLLLNALAMVPARGPVLFDEYDHGLTNDAASLWQVLPRGVRIGAFHLLAVLLLGMIAAGIRTRPALPRPPDERSRAEYLEALGGLMARAHLRALAVQQELDTLPAEFAVPALQARGLALRQEAASGVPDDARALALIQRIRALLADHRRSDRNLPTG